jgi:hypothetical protein
MPQNRKLGTTTQWQNQRVRDSQYNTVPLDDNPTNGAAEKTSMTGCRLCVLIAISNSVTQILCYKLSISYQGKVVAY